MILRFRNKGLARLYYMGDGSGLEERFRLRGPRILARLDVALQPSDMDLPGWWLHPLTGQHEGFWAVWITANWWIAFRFSGDAVVDVDLLDCYGRRERPEWR